MVQLKTHVLIKLTLLEEHYGNAPAPNYWNLIKANLSYFYYRANLSQA